MKLDKHPETWSEPLHISIGYGSADEIRGPKEALHYLMVRWPTERGHRYDAACMACANAVELGASFDIAREKFVTAAIEARLLS